MRKFVQAALNLISRRQTSYIRTFAGPDGSETLKDLSRFCRANETTFHEDPRIHARLEGRKDVWLRIQNNLHMTQKQLAVIYQAAQFEDEDNG